MAFVVVECGLTENEFWRLTPAKLFAIIDRKRDQIKREDYRTGVVAMLIRQACGVKRTTPFDDFPQYLDQKQTKSKSPSADDRRAAFQSYKEGLKKYG